MPNNNNVAAVFATGSVFIPPAYFYPIAPTPGFDNQIFTFDGQSWQSNATLNPGGAAFTVEYLAWGGNIIQIGDPGVSGGGSNPNDPGIGEMDFAVSNVGTYRFIVGANQYLIMTGNVVSAIVIDPGSGHNIVFNNGGANICNIGSNIDFRRPMSNTDFIRSDLAFHGVDDVMLIDCVTGFYYDINSVQILRGQQPAVAHATNAADVILRLNDLIDRLSGGAGGHGLIG